MNNCGKHDQTQQIKLKKLFNKMYKKKKNYHNNKTYISNKKQK